MMTPTIHLNGTSKDSLVSETAEVINALNRALAIMEANGPNARDYYPQGADAYKRAREEHEARCIKVRKVMEEYGLMLDTIDAEDK